MRADVASSGSLFPVDDVDVVAQFHVRQCRGFARQHCQPPVRRLPQLDPAAGDAGGAIGAALGAWHIGGNHSRQLSKGDRMKGAYLGPDFSEQEIRKILVRLGAQYIYYCEIVIVLFLV